MAEPANETEVKDSDTNVISLPRSEARDRRIHKLKQDNFRGEVFLRRQDEMLDDPFREIYTRYGLIMPPYNFARLMEVYVESSILQTCVSAMRDNVHAFGYQLQYLGQDQTERDKPEVDARREVLANFFDEVNEEESFRDVRMQWSTDYEVLGNGVLEGIRNRKRELQFLYHMPATYLRMTSLHPEYVVVPVKVMRNGELTDIGEGVKRKFRRYALINPYTQKMRWFKSFGDPREMDIETGEFVGRWNPDGTYTGKQLSDEQRATELIWIRNQVANSNYGLPRWIGNTYSILGRTNAEFVNYDVFDHRGIPPFYVSVSGGVLTEASYEELELLLNGLRGVEQFNRVPIIESEPASTGFEERAGSVRIEIKSLLEHMQNDTMFERYMEGCEKGCRTRFRLPPLYTGASDDYTHATAYASQTIAREQVFIPEQESFDNVINKKIVVGEFGIRDWRYVSKGPRIVGSNEISTGVRIFSNIGAFSINHAIQMANDAFGLQMSEYEQEWAKWPVPMVLKLLELGRLKDVEIAEMAEATGQLLNVESPEGEGGSRIEKTMNKAERQHDLFSHSEALDPKTKAMYLQLLTVQHWLEEYGEPEITDDDTVV